MIDRAYTVTELDALRDICRNKWIWGRYRGAPIFHAPIQTAPGQVNFGVGVDVVWGRSYKEEELVKCVEEMVRTHMLAGHTAQDLLASEPNED